MLALARLLAGLLLVASLAGCTTSVTRVTTVAPRGAADYEPRGRVIAVNGAPVDNGIVSREGRTYVLQTSNARAVLRDTDRVTVQLVYGDGDEVPGEGVVHVSAHPALILGGTLVMGAGVGLLALGAVVWKDGPFGPLAALSPLLIGGCAVAGGLAMLVVGYVVNAHIVRSPTAFVPDDMSSVAIHF